MAGGRRTTEGGNNGVEDFDPDQAADLAKRTQINRLAGELVKQRLPICGRRGQWLGDRCDVKQLAAAEDFVFDVAVGQQAEVTDADEA